MNYGYFDNIKREYVITRPDTPAPWVNYLGSPEYGAIISNNAGGYSFEKSGANGRISRYIFNSFDRSGRYIYLRDNDDGDYWSASWQPVGKDLNTFENICRHGTGYTEIISKYRDIESDTLYYVPVNQSYEIWNIKIKNNSKKHRNISVFGYVEFTNHSNYEQDQINLQYSQYITKTEFDRDRIYQFIHGNLDALSQDENIDDKNVTTRFFAMTGSKVHSWCGSRDNFTGPYRDYKNPLSVEKGKLDNSLNYNGNSCGALSTDLNIKPGETVELCFITGMKNKNQCEEIIKKYARPYEICKKELDELIDYWHSKFFKFQVKTPDKDFDTMVNTWNAYNCFMTFIWSRAASFTYCGLRNGYGYRDTVQDIQGIIHLAPELAKRKIEFMLSAQVDNGGGLPLVKFTHNPGHEDTPDDISYVRETGHPEYRADDALWLFPTVYKYIAETGDLDFLDENILFANKGEGTVYNHLQKALQFTENHLGKNLLPAGLYADWNDCLRMGSKGESVFVAMQYYYAMSIMEEFAQYKKDSEYSENLNEKRENLKKIIYDKCWDKDRFVRGIREDGTVIGKASDPEANMWLNPQSWAVISGIAGDEESKTILDNVEKRLNTEYGLILMDPPYHAHSFEGALAVIYNPGTKENSGIFSQSQGWIILAEALKGNGNRAYKYLQENLPSAQNDIAEIRKLEPYCYGQFTEGKHSPNHGQSHVHWLTGTASTMMVASVEGILGMRPDLYGITIDPSIPENWGELEINKEFRGRKLNIKIVNESHKDSGVKKLVLNGEEISDNYIKADKLKEINEITVFM